jgi:hypothetical protein
VDPAVFDWDICGLEFPIAGEASIVNQNVQMSVIISSQVVESLKRCSVVHINLNRPHVKFLFMKLSGGGIATGHIAGTEQNDESESGELTANLKANAIIASSDKSNFISGVRDLVLASSASKWLQAGG